MVCKSCGKTLRSGEKFCTVCGCYNDFDEEQDIEDGTKEELEKQLEEDEKKKEKEREREEKELLKEEKRKEKEREKEERDKARKEERKAEEGIVETEEVVEFTIKKENKEKQSKEDDILDNLSNEERPLAIFIGEDYKWIAQRPFNVFAMLFSWVYFLYRKVYLIGIIGLLITGIIIRFIPILTIPFIVISMLGIGFAFNKIYLSIAEKRVSKILDVYSDKYTYEKILRKKGGVNVVLALLIFLVFIGLVFLSYFNFGTIKKASKYSSENSDNIANCLSIGRQVYQSLEVYQVEGTLKEAACEVITSVEKQFRIYFVLTNDNVESYVLFETGNGLVSMKGNTAMIEKLESVKKQNGLAASDEEFLKESYQVRNNYQQTITDAKREDDLIRKNKDTKEKTHYLLTIDDIIG